MGNDPHPAVKQLATVRKLQDTSPIEISKKAGFSIDHLFHMEEGARNPSFKSFVAWADTLGFAVTLTRKPKG